MALIGDGFFRIVTLAGIRESKRNNFNFTNFYELNFIAIKVFEKSNYYIHVFILIQVSLKCNIIFNNILVMVSCDIARKSEMPIDHMNPHEFMMGLRGSKISFLEKKFCWKNEKFWQQMKIKYI